MIESIREKRKARVKKLVEEWTIIIEKHLGKGRSLEFFQDLFRTFCISKNIDTPQNKALGEKILLMSEDELLKRGWRKNV